MMTILIWTFIYLLLIYAFRRYIYALYSGIISLIAMNKAIRQFPTEDNNLFGYSSLLPNSHEKWMHNWKLTVKHPRYLGIRVAYILPILQITHPDIIKIVLKSHTSKGFLYEPGFKKWTGDGLLTSSGSKWRRNRKLLAPAFHGNLLRDQVIIIDKCTSILIGKLHTLDQSVDTNQGMTSIKNTIHRYLADTALQFLFSKSNSIQLKCDSYNPCDSVKIMFSTLNAMTQKPYLYSDFLFSLSQIGKRAKTEIEMLNAYADDIIQTRINARKHDGISKSDPDILDKLFDTVDENGKGLDNTEIRDEVSSRKRYDCIHVYSAKNAGQPSKHKSLKKVSCSCQNNDYQFCN